MDSDTLACRQWLFLSHGRNHLAAFTKQWICATHWWFGKNEAGSTGGAITWNDEIDFRPNSVWLRLKGIALSNSFDNKSEANHA